MLFNKNLKHQSDVSFGLQTPVQNCWNNPTQRFEQ